MRLAEPGELPPQLLVGAVPVVAGSQPFPGKRLLEVDRNRRPRRDRLRELRRLDERHPEVGVPGRLVLAALPAHPLADEAELPAPGTPYLARPTAGLAGDVAAGSGSRVGRERPSWRRIGIVKGVQEQAD